MQMSGKKGDVRQRVIKFEISASKTQGIILNSLAFVAGKLWNVANYERRNWKSSSGIKYPDWFDQKKRLKEHYWYKNLPSQTSQELLKQLHEAWHSFYKLKQNGGIVNPRPPGYKQSGATIRFLNNSFVNKDGSIRLTISKNQKEFLNKKHSIADKFLYLPIPDEYKDLKGNPKIIEIIPFGSKYKVNMIIELPKTVQKPENGIYMSIDLGINNLITCYTSEGKSYILSGRQLLSTNRYFDKQIGYYQSITYAQQMKQGAEFTKATKRIKRMYEKRRRQVDHFLHTATKKVINYAIAEGVTKIIIGDIKHIRDDKNMGNVVNQRFHKWPFGRIKQLFIYKAEDQGIQIELQEESYTSQCSPYAPEVTKEYACGKNRKFRGLYVTDGNVFNADCVGAYNILKKYLCRTDKFSPAVVGLDTPMMYRWNSCMGFVLN